MSFIRTFRGRLFVALLLVALVPTAAAVLSGTVLMREFVQAAGTAGPWDALAESGGELLERVEETGDPHLASRAERHRDQLSESLRLSRLYGFLATRFLELLPAAAITLVLFGAALAFLAAHFLARQLASPVGELVDWTGRIARSEPLPEEDDGSEVQEFTRLRAALRQMEADLRKARELEADQVRMRSWTEMARRVAHELKNPLTPMRMATARLVRTTGEENVDAARVLEEEMDRLDELARSFSTFGRIPDGPPTEVDIGEILASLARRHGSQEGDVEVSTPGSLPTAWGHPQALERAFLNLTANALDAVGGMDGGSTPEHPAVRIEVEERGVEVAVRFLDRGPGIPPAQIGRIWEPDFTTKRRGTGLGLALVRRTIEAHGGRVEARNRPEGGAEFSVFLPAGPSPLVSSEGHDA